LVTIITQGVFNHPLVRSTLASHNGASSKRLWRSSKGKSSDGTFSHLDEVEDLRPLGHGISVRGGQGRQEGEAVELPERGIKVRTEITWETSDRLDYNDRLY